MVIDFDGMINGPYQQFLLSHSGNIDDDTIFTYGRNTEVYASCAATLHNEFWVIGGQNKKRQVNFFMKKLRLCSF